MTSISSTFGLAPLQGINDSQERGRVYAWSGERLSDVAQRAGVHLDDLLQANPQFDADQTLPAGEEIRLPERTEANDRPALLADNTLYKYTEPHGRVVYSDTLAPSATGEVILGKGTQRPLAEDKKETGSDGASSFRNARDLIKAAQKHGGKLDDYIKEIDYLRRFNPVKMDAALKELQKSDPKLWVALQEHPQFRPLSEALSFEKNGTSYLEAGVEGTKALFAKGVGSVPGAAGTKLGEGTVKNLMKRDRLPGATDVLGNKATTLPAPPKPEYSNSKLGQWLKTEDKSLAVAGKQAAKDLAGAQQAARAASAAALSRVLGPILDVGIGALNTDVAAGIAARRGEVIAQRLQDTGILGAEEALRLPGMMANFQFDEVREMIEAGQARQAGNR